MQFPPFLSLGMLLFTSTVLLQLVNLPLELHASASAGRMLVQLHLVRDDQLQRVRRVMFAAAWTYVGATLQSILMLIQYAAAACHRRDSDT